MNAFQMQVNPVFAQFWNKCKNFTRSFIPIKNFFLFLFKNKEKKGKLSVDRVFLEISFYKRGNFCLNLRKKDSTYNPNNKTKILVNDILKIYNCLIKIKSKV